MASTDQSMVQQLSGPLQRAWPSSKPPRGLTGAIATEIIRQELLREGFKVSSRDVYIVGIPYQVDLLICREGALPRWGNLAYPIEDVLAVLEVKAGGIYGEEGLRAVRNRFKSACLQNPGIFCAYITFREREGYKWAATEKRLGFPVYTLCWYRGQGKRYEEQYEGDWARFISDLKREAAQVYQGVSTGANGSEWISTFLGSAKKVGKKLEAKYGLLPKGTVAEDLRRIREELP